MLEEYKKLLYQKREIFLKIKVKTGASQTKVKEILTDGTIKTDVKAVPEKGRANPELIRFLAREFAIIASKIKIISGVNKKVKLVKLVQ